MNTDIKNSFISKSGNLIVDASICIPILVIVITCLLWLTAFCGIEESCISALARSLEKNEAFGSYYLVKSEFKKTLSQEWSEDAVENISIFTFPALLDDFDGAAKTDLSIKSKFTAFPLESSCSVYYRTFKGESHWTDEDDIESLADITVYIFPKSGERFHCETCYILKSGGMEKILTKELRKEYKPCRFCNSSEIHDGSKVYICSENAAAYHRKSCSIITKQFEAVKLAEAVSMGYSPCRICGGGL